MNQITVIQEIGHTTFKMNGLESGYGSLEEGLFRFPLQSQGSTYYHNCPMRKIIEKNIFIMHFTVPAMRIVRHSLHLTDKEFQKKAQLVTINEPFISINDFIDILKINSEYLYTRPLNEYILPTWLDDWSRRYYKVICDVCHKEITDFIR